MRGTLHSTVRELKAPSLRIGALPLLAALISCLFGAIEPRFLYASNWQNIAFQLGPLALMSLAQLFPILVGSIDFSVGGLVSLVSVFVAKAVLDWGVTAGILAGLLLASGVGLVNGFLVTKIRGSPMVLTLGMLWVLLGASLFLSNGQVVYGLPTAFRLLGTYRIHGVPAFGLWGVAGFLVAHALLNYTTLGKRMYVVGANERFAWLSGIAVERHRLVAHVLCSLYVFFAALILTACLGSGQPYLGVGGLDMQSFIAVFLAGTRWGGGEGSASAVLLAALLVVIIWNGLNLINVSSYAQMVVSGSILVAVITLNTVRPSRARRRRAKTKHELQE